MAWRAALRRANRCASFYLAIAPLLSNNPELLFKVAHATRIALKASDERLAKVAGETTEAKAERAAVQVMGEFIVNLPSPLQHALKLTREEIARWHLTAPGEGGDCCYRRNETLSVRACCNCASKPLA